MPTCLEATRLASEALDHPLSWSQRIRLQLHLLICSACRSFARQLRWLQQAGVEYTDRADLHADNASLSDEARKRIQAALDQEARKP